MCLLFFTPLVSLLSSVSSCEGVESNRPIVVPILYHISMDDRFKGMFVYTDCIPQLMQMVYEQKEETLHDEIISICINLAANKRNAQLMCEGEAAVSPLSANVSEKTSQRVSCSCRRKWTEDAHEESPEGQRLPADEGHQEHLATRWTHQAAFHREFSLFIKPLRLMS